jgi:RNA polymerase sigma-70 factor, ECF subfamily
MNEQAFAEDGALFRTGEKAPAGETGSMRTVADIESVVREHARFLFKVAYSMLRNVDDAEDAVQETFLRVLRSGELPNVREVKPWLARIAWRVALDRAGRRRETPLEPLLEAGFQARSKEAPAEHLLMWQEKEALLHRLIMSLPEKLRRPLVLSTVDEMSSAEIGTVLGIPEGSVRTRLLRARRMLKEKLSAWLGGGDGS